MVPSLGSRDSAPQTAFQSVQFFVGLAMVTNIQTQIQSTLLARIYSRVRRCTEMDGAGNTNDFQSIKIVFVFRQIHLPLVREPSLKCCLYLQFLCIPWRAMVVTHTRAKIEVIGQSQGLTLRLAVMVTRSV